MEGLIMIELGFETDFPVKSLREYTYDELVELIGSQPNIDINKYICPSITVKRLSDNVRINIGFTLEDAHDRLRILKSKHDPERFKEVKMQLDVNIPGMKSFDQYTANELQGLLSTQPSLGDGLHSKFILFPNKDETWFNTGILVETAMARYNELTDNTKTGSTSVTFNTTEK